MVKNGFWAIGERNAWRIRMARCKYCGKNLVTAKGFSRHLERCRLEQSIKDTDRRLKAIRRRN